MKAVVVYESLWGNTAAVARAVAEGLGPEARVLTTAEATAEAILDADLIVAGAPVLGFKLPTEQMRESVRTNPSNAPAPPDLSHPAMSSWLHGLPAGHGRSAAFDTQVRGPFGRLVGRELRPKVEGVRQELHGVRDATAPRARLSQVDGQDPGAFFTPRAISHEAVQPMRGRIGKGSGARSRGTADGRGARMAPVVWHRGPRDPHGHRAGTIVWMPGRSQCTRTKTTTAFRAATSCRGAPRRGTIASRTSPPRPWCGSRASSS